MGQEFHVLRCSSCNFFQVHIVKKTNKWECKCCGIKQSVTKVYGKGAAKDCRIHVQKLNSLSAQKENSVQWPTNPVDHNDQFVEQRNNNNKPENGCSKWDKYLHKRKFEDDSLDVKKQQRIDSFYDAIEPEDGCSKWDKYLYKRKFEDDSLDVKKQHKIDSFYDAVDDESNLKRIIDFTGSMCKQEYVASDLAKSHEPTFEQKLNMSKFLDTFESKELTNEELKAMVNFEN